MWLGLTIARSSPASTQWCRKTELSTARAPRRDAEGDVGDAERGLDAGQLGLDRGGCPRSSRPPIGFHSSSPVVSVKVRRVEDQRLGVEAVLVAGQLLDPLGDLDLALGRLRHPDLVDRQRDQRRAVRRARAARRVSSLSRPASRLTELTIARPGICSSAALITSGSVESTWIGAGWVSETRLTTSAHLLVLVLALGQRHADVEHVGAAGRPGPRRPARARRSRRPAAAPWPCASPAS